MPIWREEGGDALVPQQKVQALYPEGSGCWSEQTTDVHLTRPSSTAHKPQAQMPGHLWRHALFTFPESLSSLQPTHIHPSWLSSYRWPPYNLTELPGCPAWLQIPPVHMTQELACLLHWTLSSQEAARQRVCLSISVSQCLAHNRCFK